MARRFLEFFAGGGMARLGLGDSWQCVFANEYDPKKIAVYRQNFGGHHLAACDIRNLKRSDIPEAELAWASFPCQDLSLAGARQGLSGERSSTFWKFWELVRGKTATIIIENVTGLITSHGGRDLRAMIEAFATEGFAIAPVVIDAKHFVPQSRPRLFLVASKAELPAATGPSTPWHPKSLLAFHSSLSVEEQKSWCWLALTRPPELGRELRDLLDQSAVWQPEENARRLLAMMSPLNRARIEHAQSNGPVVGCLYRRTRRNEAGERIQRAEVRFDGLSGCLRTPAGGSSRQTIIEVQGDRMRSRLLTAREAARLMGLPDDYQLPSGYNDAYRLAGDGVVVPVVRWLSGQLFPKD